MIKISLIIPVYNLECYLAECLESLLTQSYTNWEAICIDDGSTDASSRLLDDYATRDSRICVFHQENTGVAIARNRALARATGDFVGFVDGDDVLGVDWLQAAVDALSATKADMVKMRFRRDFNFDSYTPPAEFPTYEGRAIYAWSALKGGLTVQNFYRRELLSDVRFPEQMRIYEDGIFNLYALLKIKRGVQCEYDGYGYRFSETSAFKKRITEAEYARLIQECAQWYVAAKGCLLDAPSLRISLDRIRNYLAGRILEWYRQPARGNPSEITDAIRAAEGRMGVSLSPRGVLKYSCYRTFYQRTSLPALKLWSLWIRTQNKLRRLLGK